MTKLPYTTTTRVSTTPPLSPPRPPPRWNGNLAWIVLGVGLMMTAVATLYMDTSAEKTAERDFLEDCADLRDKISERLNDHARILRSGVALFNASDVVTREEWRVFTQRQKVDKQLPGIQGIGFSLLIPRTELSRHIQEIRDQGFPEYNVKPEGDRELYSSIIYLEPFTGRNLRAFGYDMLSEPVRRAAMEQARDTDAAALSGKVILVQETDADVQRGTLMYVPVYRTGMPIDSIEGRRAAIYGWVYSPYRMNDLIQGVLGDTLGAGPVHLEVFDGAQSSPRNLLYASPSTGDDSPRSAARFSRDIQVDFNGHCWTLCFTQAHAGFAMATHAKIGLTLVVGTVITVLLFSLIRVLLNTRAASQRMAEALTRDLRESEESYRTQFANNSVTMLLVDPSDGAILDANATALSFYGYSRDRLLAMRISDINVLPSSEVSEKMASIAQEHGARFEFQHRLADGSVRDVEVSSSRIFSGGRNILHSIIRDITDHKRADEALQSKTALLEAQLNASLDGILVIDEHQKRVLINPRLIVLFNIPQPILEDVNDAALLKHVASLAKHPEQFLQQVMRLYESPTEINRDDIEFKNGMLLDRYSAPVLCQDGSYRGRIWTFRDITARVQAEKALRLATERLSLAVRAGGVGIWDYDVVNNILAWDNQMFRLYGITKDQFTGAYEAWQAGVHPEDRQQGDTEVQWALQGKKEFDIEFRVLWPDGTIRHIRGFATVQRDASGRPLRMLGTNWDITAHREAQDAIKRQASLINSLLDSIPDIIFFKDIHGVYLGCNPPFAEFVGRPKDEIVGKTDDDLFSAEIGETFRKNDQRMLELCEARHNEETITFPNGRIMLIDTLKTPYRGPDGNLIGILGISRDITERKRAEEALRTASRYTRSLIEASLDPLVMISAEGIITDANTATETITGIGRERLIGSDFMRYFTDSKSAHAGFLKIFAEGQIRDWPLTIRHTSGRLTEVMTNATLYRDEAGNILGVFAATRDVTALMNAEKARRESEERYRTLIELFPNAISVIQNETFVYVNSAAMYLFGAASAQDLVGHPMLDRIDPDDHPQVIMALKLLSSEGVAPILELLYIRLDGATVEVELHVTAIIFNGTPAVVIVARDISERKRAEADLARLSVIQRALVHLATDFVNVPMERQDTAIDESLATMGTLIHADRAALYEYDFDRGVMSNTHEWCNAGITPAIGNRQAVPAALFPDWVKAHQRGELVHLPLADPSPNDITLQTTPVPQGIRELIALPLMQGAVCLGFISFDGGREKETWQEEDVALLRVLAELYAHFQARRRAERETLALQKSLTVARDAAQAAAAAKSLFLANMSHEIRTPLNAILGYAQIMERECRNCPTGQRLNAITRSGEHLLELITDLLELVRNDGRIITLAPATFDFLQVLEDVRLMFARPLAAQGVALEVSRTPDVPHYIHADQAKVRQVLVNLVGNAAKFTEKGSVQLSASVSETSTPNGMTLVIDIVDTGCGICEAEQTRIFELFYMAEHNQHTGKGTGLGLPLSRRYAQALGGDVTVTSQPEVGSCFRFTFQARIESGDEAIHACRESIRRLAPDQRVCHILVVDDDPTNCDMLADMLAPVGFAVEIATSAVQALNRLCQPHQIDLVLMDKSMPEMNGYEAIRRLRERPEGRALSIVVVTASGLSDEREHALAAGANGYTSKPVRRENFLHEIARVAGVRYEYERAPVADPSATQPTVLDPTALSRLPAEQRRSLDQALRRGDIRQLRSLVDTIAHDHAGLAAGIRTYVDTYDYDRLRRLLDSAEGDAL